MNRPELIPENYKEIYAAFMDFEPSLRIQNLGFTVMDAAMGAKVHYLDAADEIVAEHLESGKNIILAANHQSNSDTPALASLACREPFQLLRNNTAIPAKASMFDWPLLGRFFPHMLAHPTFRGKKDYGKYNGSEEGWALSAKVKEALVQFNIDYIDAGGNVALFPEASRNLKNPNEVQALARGLAHIALGVKNPEDLLIVPVGFAYGWRRFIKAQPEAVVSKPFSPAGMTHDEILERTRRDLQTASDLARDYAKAA